MWTEGGERVAPGAGVSGFEVRQSEFSYLASLEAPVFDMLGTGGQLYAAIYAGLAQFRVKLQDIKVESPTMNPADISVVCSLLNLGALVRYRLDRVEVWSTSPQGFADAGLAELIEYALRVVREASRTARVAGHTLSLGVHGLLTEDTITARLAAYVPRTPEGTPPFRPGGVSFSCEWPEGEGESSIVLERSAIVPDGAFLRVTSLLPGKLPGREAYQRAADFFQTAMAGLNLKFLWRT